MFSTVKDDMSIESTLISKERKNAKFPVEELTNVWDGGKEETELRRKIVKLFEDDPVLKSPPICTMTREERFTKATRKSAYIYRNLIPNNGLHPGSREFEHFSRAMPIENNLLVHMIAFIPCIKSFGSQEQVAKWLPLALNLNIIGAYAQTELGHGSFLRGIETEATFDKKTQEFVINCPKVSSMKWWPGDMGLNANHALVMANLIIDGKEYGMHAFIVQIRDLSTHMPLPGVTVGDIGSKMGFEAIDNGFLYMKNVRIPRENLLNKNSEVKPDGTYVKKASDRLMYGSMVNLRVNLPKSQAIDVLAKACTIAIRYSAVRRQGLLNPGGAEVAVLDYTLQQHKLIPQLATVYATKFAGEGIIKKHQAFLQNMAKGNISDLAEIHALSASFKASVSEQCTEGVEVCRRACGGHGYSQASGLPFLLCKITPSCTYEGENTVLYLQTARYLVKCASKQAADLPESIAFLVQPIQDMKGSITSLDNLIICFKNSAALCVQGVSKKVNEMSNKGLAMHEVWNKSSVQLVKSAKMYVMQYIIGAFVSFVTEVKCSEPIKEILQDLCCLYGLHYINTHSGEFLKLGVLSAHHCTLAEETEIQLLEKLRPNAVGIVDAFDFTDSSMESCLGAYDGNVYERLFDMAKLSPLNKEKVHQESYRHLRPFLLEGRDILEGVKSKN
uniref:Acyl-coenzyme A oxidase n=1 Tax=Phallusia mammillata TaxID=59560 RepID=A0A6F9D678_9ASCI|nr:peroxisomal acyl-coenzyme A oxidase 2 [Phallusia mammillata]